MQYEILEGVGNEVFLCFICMCIVILCVVLRIFNSDRVRSYRLRNNNQENTNNSTISNNSNADISMEVQSPSEDDINSFNAGLLDGDLEEVNSENISHKSVEHPDAESLNELDESSNLNKNVKQKTKIPNGHIIVRLQYLDDRIRYVHAPPHMPVMFFKRKFFNDEIIHQNKNVRLIFQGRELANRIGISTTCSAPLPSSSADPSLRTLCDYGIKNESIIHCLVNDLPTTRTANSINQNIRDRQFASNNLLRHGNIADLDVGSYVLFPLTALILGSTWLFRITYYEYFNVISTTALIFLSALFGGAAWSMTPSRTAVTGQTTEPAAGDTQPTNTRTIPHRVT